VAFLLAGCLMQARDWAAALEGGRTPP